MIHIVVVSHQTQRFIFSLFRAKAKAEKGGQAHWGPARPTRVFFIRVKSVIIIIFFLIKENKHFMCYVEI